ncbi:MAG: aconitate hydratase [Thaumarchaeota archaeon]|nr:aconitate hydratase [Nitrososphaerota archaeon]
MQRYYNSEQIRAIYDKMSTNIEKLRSISSMPLTLSEKIIAGHMDYDSIATYTPGKDYIFLKPDRVALQDVTGQMVILQFMQSGLTEVSIPTTVHCDHLIQARTSASDDTKHSLYENNEIYQFLESSCRKYGIGFWKPGAGIIHQVLLENYSFPGGLMIGTDSHTPNAGGLGMLAIGVGGIDASEVMAGFDWEVLLPKRIGVHLTGKLSSWCSAKDIILYLTSILTVSGGTNSIIEYFGPGTKSISCTGKATITNMGAELGATSSLFPFDDSMIKYLKITNRQYISDITEEYSELLCADSDIEKNPNKYFDKVIEINLSDLEPYVVGPHTPDLARPISQLSKDVIDNDYLDNIAVALIGSCTNSSYEDMSRVSDIAKQAQNNGITSKIPLLVTPGSEQIRATIQRDGQLDNLESIGATVLANACGPCIGQWNRPEAQDIRNTIVTSFNRNFPGRNDGSRETMNFIASPEIVVALSLSGRLSFNPLKDFLVDDQGNEFKLTPPESTDLPKNGFISPENVFIPPSSNPEVDVTISPDSKRLQLLEPFSSWNAKKYSNITILAKVNGKCTTDHISPAGYWLRYRGHIDNISDNLLLGASNSFTKNIGTGINNLTNDVGKFAEIARSYKSHDIPWLIIGDHNYGEGSSREHAAMSPRHLGCVAVIAKSFARIHETNLKKQGVLALTFNDETDYDKIKQSDQITIKDLNNFSENKTLVGIINHEDNTNDEIILIHSYNNSQIEWFKQGSALNVLRSRIS